MDRLPSGLPDREPSSDMPHMAPGEFKKKVGHMSQRVKKAGMEKRYSKKGSSETKAVDDRIMGEKE